MPTSLPREIILLYIMSMVAAAGPMAPIAENTILGSEFNEGFIGNIIIYNMIYIYIYIYVYEMHVMC